MKHILIIVTTFGILNFAPSSAVQAQSVNTGYFGGVAINGYDTVAYFTEAKAIKGSEDHLFEFLGETWHFSTAEHRAMFAENPVAYAPQYGGFCAGEMLFADATTGVTSNIDPEAWRIIDGKLYLFFDKGFAEVFEENAADMVPKADGHWTTVREELTD